MPWFESRTYPTLTTRPFRPGWAKRSLSRPMDDDPMINDPGKHSVKVALWAVSLRAGEWGLRGVNASAVIPGRERAARSSSPLPAFFLYLPPCGGGRPPKPQAKAGGWGVEIESAHKQPPPSLTLPQRKSGLPDLRMRMPNPGKPGFGGGGNSQNAGRGSAPAFAARVGAKV
jgi:hypothetical protein